MGVKASSQVWLKMSYEKEKAKREFKFKEERTICERNLRELLKQSQSIVYLLLVIAMILLGVFLRMIFG